VTACRRKVRKLADHNLETFRFILTLEIVVETLAFSLAMGFIGGFLPAMRAARMSIVDALRAR
jgi:putative ABC transport system permease protein